MSQIPDINIQLGGLSAKQLYFDSQRCPFLIETFKKFKQNIQYIGGSPNLTNEITSLLLGTHSKIETLCQTGVVNTQRLWDLAFQSIYDHMFDPRGRPQYCNDLQVKISINILHKWLLLYNNKNYNAKYDKLSKKYKRWKKE